jgi:hypothetical protein
MTGMVKVELTTPFRPGADAPLNRGEDRATGGAHEPDQDELGDKRHHEGGDFFGSKVQDGRRLHQRPSNFMNGQGTLQPVTVGTGDWTLTCLASKEPIDLVKLLELIARSAAYGIDTAGLIPPSRRLSKL